ncbi:MAG: hypothetical protein ACKOQ2_37415 [Dolichospermum sp.]
MIDFEYLDKFEGELILNFRGHCIFQEIETMAHEKFLDILIQRRFLSYEITNCYDMAIDGLNNEKAIEIARQIVREEYPGLNGKTPSHREDLMHDLLALGATKSRILKSAPTRLTSLTIESTKELIRNAVVSESDHKILTILRFWSEVLVSVEYGEFWRRISLILGTDAENKSRFYYPHFCHDHRTTLVKSSLSSSTHSGRIGVLLKNLLKLDEDKKSFIDLEEDICSIRRSFYDQFAAV